MWVQMRLITAWEDVESDYNCAESQHPHATHTDTHTPAVNYNGCRNLLCVLAYVHQEVQSRLSGGGDTVVRPGSEPEVGHFTRHKFLRGEKRDSGSTAHLLFQNRVKQGSNSRAPGYTCSRHYCAIETCPSCLSRNLNPSCLSRDMASSRLGCPN